MKRPWFVNEIRRLNSCQEGNEFMDRYCCLGDFSDMMDTMIRNDHADWICWLFMRLNPDGHRVASNAGYLVADRCGGPDGEKSLRQIELVYAIKNTIGFAGLEKALGRHRIQRRLLDRIQRRLLARVKELTQKPKRKRRGH